MERTKLTQLTETMEREGGIAAKYAKEMHAEFDMTSDAPLTEVELKDIEDLLKRLDNELNKPLVKGKRIQRNEPCPCGSGIKFKKCCAPFIKKN